MKKWFKHWFIEKFLWTNMFLKIWLLYYFKFSFRRRYFIIYKTDSVNVPTQIHDFERRLSTQTQYLLLIHRGNVLFVSN